MTIPQIRCGVALFQGGHREKYLYESCDEVEAFCVVSVAT